MSYFIDSGIFIGAFYEEDQYHREASETLERLLKENCYTSVYVLTEVVSYLTGKARNKNRKIEVEDYLNILRGENIIQDSSIILLQVDESIISEAKAGYNKYYDLGLDLTDWTNAILMNKNKITQIASYDQGYDRLKQIKQYQKIKRTQ
jgi:predicted nucleic acid-binding protein